MSVAQQPGHPAGTTCAHVRVWQVDLGVSGSELAETTASLTRPELARAERGTPTVRRRRIVLRAALRTVLGQVLGCAPAEVPLTTGPHGRPQLDLPDPPYDVNCSRSDDLGLVALARGARVGIDVERVVPWTAGTAQEGWLTPAEVEEIEALLPAERARAATRRWTQKEAVLKARGTGLTTPPAQVAVHRTHRGSRSGSWALTPVAVPAAFEASLACSTPVRDDDRAVVPLVLPIPAHPDGTPP
jgi:4'-phosphopantetheinyl transferase